MSDFGFDAYALDDAEPAGHPHPLEIARDLIAVGKSHAALEMLSSHHEQLADDPEYLLLCSEAWLANGDTLRAQQALLGAARLAPEDPRPLHWLGELLAERGEHEKAERLMEKARALDAAADDPLGETGPEAEDDLIAFAERQERSAQAILTPRQALLGTLVLGGVALVIVGIAQVTRTESDDGPSAEAPAVPDPAPIEANVAGEAASSPQALAPTEAVALPPRSPSTPVLIPDTEPPARLEPPKPPSPRKAVAPPRTSAPVAKVTAKSKPKASVATRAPAKEPSATLVATELASMEPGQLTARADALYAQGHTGIAASYYRRALELDPDFAPALVGMGQGILRAKKYSEAMQNASRALQLARGVDARPGLEAVAIYQMGRVHYERAERDAARRLFRQSISLPGTPPEAWFYLGEALSSDNSPAARQAYEEYLELVSEGHLADRARRAIR